MFGYALYGTYTLPLRIICPSLVLPFFAGNGSPNAGESEIKKSLSARFLKVLIFYV